MSEEQKKESGEEADKEKSAMEVHSAAHHQGSEGEEITTAEKIARSVEKANPIVLLLFMIMITIVVLAAIKLRGNNPNDSDIRSDDPVMAALKADLDARRTELNRQRIAMGLPPLEGGSEPIEDIAKRLKSDTDTLVGLAGRFQQMLGDKDAENSRSNSKLLTLEKRSQDISLENSRLQAEMNRALLAASEADQLRKSVADIQAQRDAISNELAVNRSKLAEAAGSVDAQDYGDLQRRYDEVLRSKAFFENRVKELEAIVPQK